ncbi:cupin domain-containing protein [Winogradskyella sp. KYW1333]|uniref:cupin domain-containing protein n=1 Tax=Winogradskyella sp. KYW1333 TaxID=2282123 RepID=UPI000DF3A5E6|nr:cupin domain-containing protein [Winogradskyella sp. KYW1333]RCT54650.1 cupin domain-containing protein [Winogradskyella sp. KYW1333]
MKKIIILFCFTFIFLVACKSNKTAEITVISLAKTSKSWNGKLLPKYLDGNPEITILKIIIPPKAKLPLHKHPEINAGVLLKGKLRVISKENDTLMLKAGEPIVELVNVWHYGENPGTVPAEIIVFYAGVKGTPITIIK